MAKQCAWDTAKKTCNLFTDTTTPTSTKTTSTYCTPMAEADCIITTGCAWVNKACTHFTGCTPFKFTTIEECQAISKACISDGVHCVPIDKCNTYKVKKSCEEANQSPLCYWDETAKVCVDADVCEKLPKTFTTDK